MATKTYLKPTYLPTYIFKSSDSCDSCDRSDRSDISESSDSSDISKRSDQIFFAKKLFSSINFFYQTTFLTKNFFAPKKIHKTKTLPTNSKCDKTLNVTKKTKNSNCDKTQNVTN